MRARTTLITIALLAGSTTGVAAQEEAAPPAEFTAEWGFQAGCCSIVEPASDPRFVGDVDASFGAHGFPMEGGLRVASRAFHVENDQGLWRGVPQSLLFFADGTASDVTQTFIGEGDYAGSYAVVHIITTPEVGVELHGFIFEGEPPVATP